MADAPVTIPVKLVENGTIGIHTDANPVAVSVANIHEATRDVINEIIAHTDAIISEVQKSPDLNDHVAHLHQALHNLCVIATCASIFIALILTVIAASLVIGAIALHKIAKQGESEIEIDRIVR